MECSSYGNYIKIGSWHDLIILSSHYQSKYISPALSYDVYKSSYIKFLLVLYKYFELLLYSIAVIMDCHHNRGALLTAVKDSISVHQSRELQFTDLEISKNVFDLAKLFVQKIIFDL